MIRYRITTKLEYRHSRYILEYKDTKSFSFSSSWYEIRGFTSLSDAEEFLKESKNIRFYNEDGERIYKVSLCRRLKNILRLP